MPWASSFTMRNNEHHDTAYRTFIPGIKKRYQKRDNFHGGKPFAKNLWFTFLQIREADEK